MLRIADVNHVRPRPPVLRALGAKDPPETILVDGAEYLRTEILKHDSWAATAIYTGATRKLIAKFNRIQSIFGLQTQWIGNRLASRERCFLTRLADLPNVPRPCGKVFADGRHLPNAMAREFVPGRPLLRDERVPDEFFPSLLQLIREMHHRGIAYVDLHKRENILVSERGEPYLIDFQIGFDVTHRRVRWLPGVEICFDFLRKSDLYHIRKHIKRHRPDQLESLFPDPVAEIPWWIQLHRAVAVPIRTVRRRLLIGLGVRGRDGMADSEHFPEDAVRREAVRKAA